MHHFVNSKDLILLEFYMLIDFSESFHEACTFFADVTGDSDDLSLGHITEVLLRVLKDPL